MPILRLAESVLRMRSGPPLQSGGCVCTPRRSFGREHSSMRAGGCETWLCVYSVTKSVQTPTCANVSQTHMRMDTLWQKPRHRTARQRIRGRACESKRGCTARCTSCSNANSSVATPVNINSRLYINAGAGTGNSQQTQHAHKKDKDNRHDPTQRPAPSR